MLRIVLADDHDMIRFGLRHLLERKLEWKVCGKASNAREAAEIYPNPEEALLAPNNGGF